MKSKSWQGASLAVYALLTATWLLIGLARIGWFVAWPVALPLLLLALAGGFLAWWRQPSAERWVIAALSIIGFLLYTPPAEHLPLFGDSAIYVNEGAYLARTGGIDGLYEPLAALSSEVRGPFYVANTEQFPQTPLQSYAGILYGGYYLVDLTGPTLQVSRLPLNEVWLALFIKLVGIQGALYTTPLWSIGALILFYLIARHFTDQKLALWAVLLLGISYPQIHFSKAPYAEIPGQFWTLLGLYFALYWIEERRPWQLVTVLLCWTTTWAGRIDALLLLSGIGVLGLMAATVRDRRSLGWAAGALPLCALLAWLAANRPYIGATYEIVAMRWSWFGPALLALLLALPLGVALFWAMGRRLQGWLQQLAPIIHWMIFAACLFVIAWSTLPNPWREDGVTRRYQEIIWLSSYYLTPLFFWLALAGIGRLFWRGYNAKELLLLSLTLTLGALFFMNYTSAPVYPVSLRRLISDVIPFLSLLAAVALKAIPLAPVGSLRSKQAVQWGLGALAIGWMAWLSWPVLHQDEAKGSLAFIQEFHENLPGNSVLIFENQDGDSWVGWLAAPLYSLYGNWALQLDSDEPDGAIWRQAIDEFSAGGRDVYLVSQHHPLPEPLLPAGYTATLVLERVWQSTLIGQTRAPYPPPYWEFAHPVYLYKLD